VVGAGFVLGLAGLFSRSAWAGSSTAELVVEASLAGSVDACFGLVWGICVVCTVDGRI